MGRRAGGKNRPKEVIAAEKAAQAAKQAAKAAKRNALEMEIAAHAEVAE